MDYQKSGMIRDDDLYDIIVKPLPKGCHLVCLFDCCHSGTVLDLPYVFTADGEQSEMLMDQDFDFEHLFGAFGSQIGQSLLQALQG